MQGNPAQILGVLAQDNPRCFGARELGHGLVVDEAVRRKTALGALAQRNSVVLRNEIRRPLLALSAHSVLSARSSHTQRSFSLLSASNRCWVPATGAE